MSNNKEASSKTMPRVLKSPFKTALATVPRVMRSRIVKATKRPSKSKKTPAVNAETQPITGKGSPALGATPPEVKAPLGPPSDASEEMASKSPKEHRKGTILNPELIEVPTADEEQTKKLRSREMVSLQQKAIIANLGRTNCGKQASKGKLNNRIGMINQPKKGF